MRIFPGTLNLCADREVILPRGSIALRPHDRPGYVPWMKARSGYAPRLYPAHLEGRAVWLFRWSDGAHLPRFVVDTPSCGRRRLCEVVAAVHLRSTLGLRDGDRVTLWLPR